MNKPGFRKTDFGGNYNIASSKVYDNFSRAHDKFKALSRLGIFYNYYQKNVPYNRLKYLGPAPNA
ncbi:Putative protein [Zobellia galactanivorans]|uniref:Uncharacterized protein n=1 Tax=Zobellia galactanivorans (strain DSM 12802 / CCUG 47099 / CIP 106680 / NCIMB 13871 / Dsij) TaxID=63186 RepID=G0L669_ZOBGA|nr:Putative protein [Zobellia galactanivorans]